MRSFNCFSPNPKTNMFGWYICGWTKCLTVDGSSESQTTRWGCHSSAHTVVFSLFLWLKRWWLPEVNLKSPRFLDLFSCCLVGNADKLPSVPGTFSFALPWIFILVYQYLPWYPTHIGHVRRALAKQFFYLSKKGRGILDNSCRFSPKPASYKVHISA